MAMPTVAAAAAVVPGVACGSSTRRVGVGNGNASAHAGGGCLAGGRRGAAAWVARARVAEAPPVAAEGSRQEAPAAPMVEIPVTCYQVFFFFWPLVLFMDPNFGNVVLYRRWI